ncbi:MAG TPA: phenylalanine--tRNA ligase subunit beta [Thermoanaerobaculia bacterium]|nr:phenylalanine--tRNA ligase subunit beta [Thermoanaerobaculia bacterium]
MKFSLEWLGDFVDTAAAGGADGSRALLDRAGIPIESVEKRGADAILEAEITPNRPDAMGHRGLAREIAAMAGIPMKEFAARYAEPEASGEATEQVASIVLQVPALCRRFGARMVRGIGPAPAPALVRDRLAAIGAKSISAAVDATNYVLWDTGQPLHAFDFDKLAGGLLIIRKARKGEKLVTLDGVERVLESSDVVVADAERAVSLAGIMGGLDTAVTDATTNVLLEAAWWDPATVRRTARRLGMHTDASHRFERSADIDAIPGALNLAARLLVESSGGAVAPGLLDVHGKLFRIRRTALRLARLRLLSGDSRLGLDFAEEALGRLGFTHERKGKRLSVTIPLFRTDVRREDDLVEEVLRVYGYDRLPTRLPPASGAGEVKEPLRGVEDRLSDAAAAAGLFETVNYPFVDRDGEEHTFGDWLRLTDTALEPLALVNPLDASRRHLRATLLPGLLDAVARNLRHGARESALFEVGRAFGSRGESDKPESYESRRFAFALAGDRRSHWSVPEKLRPADFFDAKGLVETLLGPWVAAPELVWKPVRVEAFTEGAAATLETRSGALLGIAGLVAGAERQRRGLTAAVFAGEILVDAIPAGARPFHFEEYSTLPAISADLSFAQPKDLAWRDLEAFVRSCALAHLESLGCVDRYEGPGVAAGQVKTTIRLTFRAPDRTLEQEEVNREMRRLAEELASRQGITFA